MIEGVDFAYGRPSGHALVAAGKHFVVRYIKPGDGRSLTAQEVRDYRNSGLAICLVYESTASRPLSGRVAGKADASLADLNAAALGFPADIPIYFAADFNASAGQYPVIDEYLRGAASVIGLARVGVYGHNRLMAHCDKANTASWFWQTYAWSAGAVYAGNHLYQYHNGQTVGGAGVDFDRAMKSNYGQWDPPGIPTAPPSDVGEMPIIVGSGRVLGDVAAGVPYYDAPNGTQVGTTGKMSAEWLGSPTLADGATRDPDWCLIVGLNADLSRNPGVARYIKRAALTNTREWPADPALVTCQKEAASYHDRLVKINGLSAV